jgi:hypothetical protein
MATIPIFIIALLTASAALFMLGTVGGTPGTANYTNATMHMNRTDFLTSQRRYYGKLVANVHVATSTGALTEVGVVTQMSLGGVTSREIKGTKAVDGTITTDTAYFSSPFRYSKYKSCAGQIGGLKDDCQKLVQNCPTNGQAATGCNALCFIFTFVLAIIEILAFCKVGGAEQISVAVKGILLAMVYVFFIAGMVAYSAGCFNPVYDYTRSEIALEITRSLASDANIKISYNLDYAYGPGFAAPIAAGIMSLLALIIMVYAPAQPATPAPQTMAGVNGAPRALNPMKDDPHQV